MWIKTILMSLVVILALIGCKKDIISIDREDNLVIDTASFLYKASYVSHTANDINIQIDIVTFKGLESEKLYDLQFYSDSSLSANIAFDVSNVSAISLPIANKYSTVFLINKNNKNWYSEQHMGFYLRRYFEMNENVQRGKIALASFSAPENLKTSFHSEVSGTYFQNSWEYNLSEFYQATKNVVETSTNTQVSYVVSRIDEAIDSMVLSGELVGDRSITLFADEIFGTSSDLNLDVTIAKAVANAIAINLIGPAFNSNIRRLALETGGFICEFKNNPASLEITDEQNISKIAVGMLNFEKLLNHDLSVHRCDFVVTDVTANFQSGDMVSYTLNYNGELYNIDLKIP